jgi:hypothetical protein
VAASERLELTSRRVAILIPILGLVVLIVRRWDSLVHPQFIYEDAAAFWAATFVDSGPDAIFRPWAGFFRVTQRLIFQTTRLSPAPVAPAVAVLILYVVIALVAAFLVSSRMSSAIPSQPARNVVAGFLFVIPATTEMLGSALNVEWFLWIYLVCLCLASPPRRAIAALESIAGVVVGLTGPIVIALLPVLIWRQGRDRPRFVIAMTICALAQGAMYVTSFRRPAPVSDAVDSVLALLRQTGTSIVGARFGTVVDAVGRPWLLAAVGLLVLVGIVVCARNLPRPTATCLFWAAGSAGLAGLISVGSLSLQLPGQNPRYFIVTAILAVASAAVAMDRRSIVGLGLGLLAVIGAAGDFAVAPLPPSNWATQSGCIGGPAPCRVDVYPDIWSVDWPGSGATYQIPRGFTSDGRPLY